MVGTAQGFQKRLMGLGNEKIQELAMELMQSEKFQQAFATAFGKAMAARQQVNKNMSVVLAALQVPTQGDLERLSDRIDKLRGQIRDLDGRLEALAAAPKAAGSAAKPTRKRPATKKKAARKAPRAKT